MLSASYHIACSTCIFHPRYAPSCSMPPHRMVLSLLHLSPSSSPSPTSHWSYPSTHNIFRLSQLRVSRIRTSFGLVSASTNHQHFNMWFLSSPPVSSHLLTPFIISPYFVFRFLQYIFSGLSPITKGRFVIAKSLRIFELINI